MTQTKANRTAAVRFEPAVAVRDAALRTGHALELHYRFILWLVPALDARDRTIGFRVARVVGGQR